MKLKTFRVCFIDARDGGVNEKLLQAQYIEHACHYMRSQGHEIISIAEVKQ